MSEGPRRRVTYTQLEALWEFLNEHRDIATGYNKTARARDNSKKMWQSIAQTLNAQGDGAIKDWKGWNKYWNDYKSKLKKSVAGIRASRERTGGGPSDVNPLSEIENKFLLILGDSFGSGLPGVRVEPFDQAPEIEVVTVDYSHSIAESDILLQNIILPSSEAHGSSSIRQSPPSSVQQPTQLTQREPSPEILISRSPQPQTPRQSPRLLDQRSRQQLPSTSHRTPQRRRIRRREPPQSQEATRRALILISEQRSQHDQTRNELMRELIQEIKDIKEILRTRLPLPDTPVLNL